MEKLCYVLLCLVGFALSGAITENVKPRPGQFIKQKTYLYKTLPMNASKLEVCINSEPNVKTCDIYKTTASFSTNKKLIHSDQSMRFFFDKVTRINMNIFDTKGNITLTLKNTTNDIITAILYPTWISQQMHQGKMILPITTHPAKPKDMHIIENWNSTDIDFSENDFVVAAVILEVFCDSEYYGQECFEHCPQGCLHGTCNNGTCSNCEYPYHGEACDLCGETGKCEHGMCKETENGNIMSGKCECNDYYEGPQCDTKINNCTIVRCSPQGRCDMTTHKCVCFGYFVGDFCEEYNYWRSKSFVTDCLAYGTLIICFLFISIKVKWSEWVKAICSSDMEEPKDNISTGSNDDKDLITDAMRLDIIEGRETFL